jgi:transcriptional regulator with XRE-family HTH domain
MLGELLRAWRDRTSPLDVGLRDSKRRAPGLKREELAALADLSVDYVVRLEQGRSRRPSPHVVASLASALRLDSEETETLYSVAGLTPPLAAIERQVPPSVRRLVTRLENLPAAVYSADWFLLSWNGLWSALLGEPPPTSTTGPEWERNLICQVFSGQSWRATPCDRPLTEFQSALVSDLRTLAATHPDDPTLISLVDQLRTQSPAFAAMWEAGTTKRHQSERKVVHHPDVGEMTLDCDVAIIPSSDVRLLIYSAEAGSQDWVRLRSLAGRFNDDLPPG